MLKLHRSERADHLVEALGDLLAGAPLADPMTAEVVAVPTRGVERWLTQRLSHRLGAEPGEAAGVCAHMSFPFPGVLIGQALAGVGEVEPAQDPWRPERCVWPLVELIDWHAEDPELAPLTAHLRAATPDDSAGEPGELRRFGVARHLADLFDHYAIHRPEMLRAWASGDLPGAGADPTARWQAYLWCLLRDSIDVPSPAERFATAVARLADQPDRLELPERVSLFGLTRLPASHLDVLQAVADARDVHLFLLHPSGQLWDRVAGAAPAPGPALTRHDDPTVRLAAHPLLRSWGRDAREMQLVLAGRGLTGGDHRPVGEGPPTLLGRLQSDIRADRSPPGLPGRPAPPGPPDPSDPPGPSLRSATAEADARLLLDPTDRSLRIHACHGRARQVEVIRDALLHLLAQDPTLEPRDVIVMCPDIETFAPLIHAAFGPDDPLASDTPGSATGLPHLRVRLADRSVRQTNPLLGLAAQLLVLAGSRLTASEVVDLAARPPVARRFRFDQDDLSTLQRWVAETGVRWGLDADHRRPWALDHVSANTWSAGMDRLLLGITMGEGDGRTFGATLPYDDLGSSDVDLAGRVAEMVERLAWVYDRMQAKQTVDAWVDALITGTELLAQSSEEWHHDQLRRVLTQVGDEATPAAGAGRPDTRTTRTTLTRAEVQELLTARLQGRPTVANFRTGDLTICTLVPMRSVPHRVVALLGLDDGEFPRHPAEDGDDLLLVEPRVGDRDPRAEDRQLLLDALLAATDHLIITYCGRDERTNRERPPAVPVAELLDTIDATARAPDGGLARDIVVTEHPLQSFDPRNFSTGQPWSYDRVQLAGAQAFADQVDPRPWLPGPLPPLDEPVIQLDDLVRFVEHPVRAFLRRRLGLYLGDWDEELSDGLPLDLDALEKWGVGDRLLRARLAGVDPDRAAAAERSRGLLPPGPLADGVLTQIGDEVERLATAMAALGAGPSDSLDLHLELPDGRSLIGTVPNLRGQSILHGIYSRLGYKHRLAAWVRFLAVSAARPDLDVTFTTVGRGQGHQPPQASRLTSLGPTGPDRRARALAQLDGILELYQLGLLGPVPLICDTSGAWADATHRGRPPDEAHTRAKQAWDGGRWDGESRDPEHRRVWPGPSPLDDPLFPTLAAKLWNPLLAHEQLGPA